MKARSKSETTINLIIILMTIALFFIVSNIKADPQPEGKPKYTKINVIQRFKNVEFTADSSYCAVSTGTNDTVNFRVIHIEK